MLIVPVYTAKAEVRIRPIIPRLVFKTEDNGPIPLYQSFMNTQVSIMRSPTVSQRVLDHRDVQQTEWYKNPPKSLFDDEAPSSMERLRVSLSASPRPDTEIIDLSFKARNAKDAATIMNAVLDQYISYISEMSSSTRDAIYRQLADQYKFLENEIQGREKVLAKLRQELGTGVPEELVAMKRRSLEDAEGKYRGVYLDMSVAKWRQERLVATIEKIKAEARKRIEDNEKKNEPGDRAAPAGVPATQPAEVQPQYRRDRDWRRMDVQIRTLQHQIKSASRDFKPGYPTMVKLAGELKFAEEMLALRQTQLDDDWKNRSKLPTLRAPIAMPGQPVIDPQRPEAAYEAKLQTVTAELGLLKHQANLLLAAAKKEREDFAEIFQSAQMLEKENEALRHKKRLFNAVRERLDHKEMERNVPGSIEVLTRAMAASKPSGDNRVLLTILFLFGAVVVGSTCGLIRARHMSSRYRISDLGGLLEMPFLGKLPLVRGCPRAAPMTNTDDQALLDGVRIVSTALLSRLGEKPGRMVLVTSPDAEVGRSSVAAMLAGNLARCGMKVLLVDADMRNGTLSRTFGLQEKPGVADSLCAADPLLQNRTYDGDIPNLHIMPAGPKADRRGVERIVRGRFTKCMECYRSDYDVILVDGPPVLPVADARVLSEQVDGTVLIVREGETRRVDVTDALASLRSAGGNVLGTVVLGFERTEIHQASPPITGSATED
jgi:capsular exopolysaccharide synthesis family protein